MKNLVFVSIISAVLISATGARAEGIKEGKWTMTITTKMEGMESQAAEMDAAMANMSEDEKAMMQQMMPGMKMNTGGNGMGMTTTTTQCVTNDKPVPQSTEEGCAETHSMDGNTVKFETTCPESKSTGEVTYNGDSMEGTIKSQSAEGAVTIDIAGQYVGPCDQ